MISPRGYIAGRMAALRLSGASFFNPGTRIYRYLSVSAGSSFAPRRIVRGSRDATWQARSCASSKVQGTAAFPDVAEGCRNDEPTKNQLIQLGLISAVPFVGFGFMDNFVMILAGDAIDASIGVKLGASTMCAAALGNTCSDVVGVWAGDWIEAKCNQAGLREPRLTDEQRDSRQARFVKTCSSVLGLVTGCLLGMFPLLFQSDRKPLYFTGGNEEVYDSISRPHDVTMQEFFELMKVATVHNVDAGANITSEGTPFDSVVLVIEGSAIGENKSHKKRRMYKGMLNENHHKQDIASAVPASCKLRGSFIGFTAVLETARSFPYPYTITTTTATQYFQWPREELKELMEQHKSLENAMLSIMHSDLLDFTQRQMDFSGTEQAKPVDEHHAQALKNYGLMLNVAVSDNFVHPAERKLCKDYRRMRGLTEEDHRLALKAVGWTLEDWQRGSLDHEVKGATWTADDLRIRIPKLLETGGHLLSPRDK